MAYLKVENVSIKGIAACVPKNIIKNSDYYKFTENEYFSFLKNVGVAERRIVGENQCTSDLCFNAALRLFEKLNVNPEEIDLVVFVSHTPDYKLPATSCILQDRLKISNEAMCFDVSLGCSGFPYGLQIVSKLLSKSMKRGLLLIGNTQSLYTTPEDKSVYPLFADAGGALLIEYSEEDKNEMFFHSGTDGSGFEDIIIPDGGCRNIISPESLILEQDEDGNKRARIHERLDGMNVFTFGIKKGFQAVSNLINYFKIENIDYLLIHQANLKIIQKIVSKLNINAICPINIDRFGNTSAASIPLLMVTELRNQDFKNKKFISVGFGVGLSWGSTAFNLNDCIICDLVEI
jgi:3-oxoacyl-[acyl-carrier-protein] synthase-3